MKEVLEQLISPGTMTHCSPLLARGGGGAGENEGVGWGEREGHPGISIKIKVANQVVTCAMFD